MGVQLYSIAEGGLVQPFVADLLATLAQEEVRRLAERVSDIRQRTTSLEWYFPGRTPLGFQFRDRTPEEKAEGAPSSVLDLDAAAAPHVARLYDLAGQGASLRSLVNWAIALPPEVRGRRRLGRQAILAILRSPVYISRPTPNRRKVLLANGEYAWRRPGEPATPEEIVAQPKCRWPAIVTDELWLQVQHELDRQERLSRKAPGKYLLSGGLLRCPTCGARMVARGQRADRGDQYRCPTSSADRGVAGPPPHDYAAVQRPVDEAVLREVKPLIEAILDPAFFGPSLTYPRLDPDDDNSDFGEPIPTPAVPGKALAPELWRRLESAWRQVSASDQDALDEAAEARLRRTAGEARELLGSLTLMLAGGKITQSAYEAAAGKAEADLAEAERTLERIERSRAVRRAGPTLESALALLAAGKKALDEGDVPGQRRLLAELVESVTPVRVGRGRYDVRIEWTPLAWQLWSLGRLFSPEGARVGGPLGQSSKNGSP